MSKTARTFIQVVIALALIGAGVLGMGALKERKPTITRQKTPAPLPMVRTMEVNTSPQCVVIRGEGTARPLREIHLVPQVAGKVVLASPALVKGGEFRKGEILIRIEQEDYRLGVTLAQAKIKEAESKLQLIEAEAAAAREEWRTHNGGKAKTALEPPPLVIKGPQLLAAQARLEADRADLRKAELNLGRTEISAPFSGRVSEESVGVGQYVAIGQKLATLFATEAVEIVMPMEDSELAWFHVPGFTTGSGAGAKALVSARVAGEERTWEGQVVRTEGKLDERTRMVNVVVRVADPYARKPPLAVGLFVQIDIQGCTLPKTTVIPRGALHQDGIVWVVGEGRLRFRKVEVARIEGDRVLIKAGLQDGERVVLSPLTAPTDRMLVRDVPAEG